MRELFRSRRKLIEANHKLCLLIRQQETSKEWLMDRYITLVKERDELKKKGTILQVRIVK